MWCATKPAVFRIIAQLILIVMFAELAKVWPHDQIYREYEIIKNVKRALRRETAYFFHSHKCRRCEPCSLAILLRIRIREMVFS